MEDSDHGVDFVQIGCTAIRLDNIAWVLFTQASGRDAWVDIVMVGGAPTNDARLILDGKRAKLFKEWWDAHANVWVIEEEEQDE